MAIKVRSNWDGQEYLLVGSGFGLAKPSGAASGFMLGSSHEQGERIEMVALCDREGAIHWSRSRDVDVIEIDGKAPSDWLG